MLLSIRPAKFRRWSTTLLFLFTSISLYAIYSSYRHLNGLRFPPGPPTVNLVLASLTLKASHKWTDFLTIPNITVITYIADNPSAPYHPPANKGNEAISYLTYLHDFYNDLPDISIFIHGSDSSWHIDGVLDHSTRQALNRLDLEEVRKRGYLNLRTSWENACPIWINTSITLADPRFDEKLREEEPYIKGAIQEMFPRRKVPAGLASPCCSQFAVTKERIRSIPRAQYKSAIDWLMNTELESKISGRIWEHLWHWLFLKREVDCPSEWRALCVWYHICFEDEQDWVSLQEMEAKRYEFVKFHSAKLANGLQPGNKGAVSLREGIAKLDGVIEPWKSRAFEKGKDEAFRRKVAVDLYKEV
ncbi:hypothetical protein EG329_005531 [Mollisiaceae sp. DMI_Dod_QoI]|nr:hypothetical protein EG329_005531 [Helotiales sp. DMI_Dod_QoI]